MRRALLFPQLSRFLCRSLSQSPFSFLSICPQLLPLTHVSLRHQRGLLLIPLAVSPAPQSFDNLAASAREPWREIVSRQPLRHFGHKGRPWQREASLPLENTDGYICISGFPLVPGRLCRGELEPHRIGQTFRVRNTELDIAQFNALHMPALERDEVRHNLLLGLMSQPSRDLAGEARRWTLGGAGACAIRTNANRSIIFGRTGRAPMPCARGSVCFGVE